MSTVKVKPCICENQYQDSKYGKNQRVMNQTKKQDGKVYRCTACGREQQV